MGGVFALLAVVLDDCGDDGLRIGSDFESDADDGEHVVMLFFQSLQVVIGDGVVGNPRLRVGVLSWLGSS